MTEIRALRQEILDVLANVEVNIDYPEYDEEEVTAQKMLACAEAVSARLTACWRQPRRQILRNGLKTAIVGRPNGQVLPLNYLTQSDKAIVTDVAGPPGTPWKSSCLSRVPWS